MGNTSHADQAFTALTYLIGDGAAPLLQAYGAMGARTVDQNSWLAGKETQYPFVDNWDVIKAGLDYPDVPNAESWMPHYNTAWDRLQAFADRTGSTTGLNMDNEIADLRADLESIFNDGHILYTPTPTLTLTPTKTVTKTATPTLTSTPTRTRTPTPTGPSVAIIDFAFQPTSLTVNVGDTVTWTNTGSLPHTVTSNTNVWTSATVNPGASFSFTFTTPGTYAYRCSFHTSMTGTIIVGSTATPTLTPTPTSTRTPTPTPVVQTFTSAAVQDGWILESSENSNAGGSLNAAATTIQLGDDAANRQYKVILSFDTKSLPDGATIKSALLKIKQSGVPVGSNPFNVLGSLWADIRQGPFGTAVLQLGDFNTPASATKVGAFNKIPANGWYTDTLTAAGLGKVNKLGLTQLRLYFATDDNNNHRADYMKFFSGNNTINKPVLVITYTVP
jgi:plastocyanin